MKGPEGTSDRILIVSDTLGYVNGVTRLYQGVLEEISASHPRISVAVLHPGEKDRVTTVAGNVRLISHRPRGYFRMPGYPQMIAGIPRRAAFRTAEEELGGVDLVHLATQGFFGYFARRWADRRNIPMVGFYHTCLPCYMRFYLAGRFRPGKAADALCRKAGEFLDRLVFGGCQSLLCHTEGMRKALAEYLPVKVSLATQFLILDEFRRTGGLREKPGGGEVHLGYVGRVAREKSLDTVMRHLPEMRAAGIAFHIVGEGPHLAELPHLGLAVRHGCLHGKALADSYGMLDFLVVPSTSETMCIAILEAAACGVPSVVLAGTAPAEVLERYRCGLTVESMEDSAWIDTLLTVRKSRLYRQLRKNGLRMARENSIARGASVLVGTWKRTIRENTPGFCPGMHSRPGRSPGGRKGSRQNGGAKMRRDWMVQGLVFVVSLCVSSTAFGWGSATHACIDERLGMRNGQMSPDKIYAGLAPDLFNYSFDLPFLGSLYAGTHYDFMKIRRAARSGAENALAYGFVSHNDAWGADFTAHHAGRTFGQEEGYVIAKARALAAVAPLPAELGIPENAALELYHNFVETAVDMLVKRNCPEVGQIMTSSALFRSDVFPALLARAYGADFAPWFGGAGQASAAIARAEGGFREQMAVYGQVLDQDEATAVRLLSGQMASLAVAFLEAYGVELPPGVDTAALAEAYIYAAMGLCRGDYQAEVEATIDFIEQHH